MLIHSFLRLFPCFLPVDVLESVETLNYNRFGARNLNEEQSSELNQFAHKNFLQTTSNPSPR